MQSRVFNSLSAKVLPPQKCGQHRRISAVLLTHLVLKSRRNVFDAVSLLSLQDQVTDVKVRHKLYLKVGRPDFLSEVLNKSDKTGMTVEILETSNTGIMIVTDTETIASTSLGVTSILFKNPDTMAKPVEKIRQFLKKQSPLPLAGFYITMLLFKDPTSTHQSLMASEAMYLPVVIQVVAVVTGKIEYLDHLHSEVLV